MKIGGDYDSPEKQAIRERLWDPAISDLVENHGKQAGDLRFLDLPGAECVYLKQIIDRFGVKKENIVAVEQHEAPRLAIHRFLGGKGLVRLGQIEDLCESGELKKYFPIDVVNLDFCGQGFVFPDLKDHHGQPSGYQRRWDCIKYVMDANREKECQSWYLLLTLFCERNNPAGQAFLDAQVNEIMDLTGIAKNPTDGGHARLIQEVVPKILADEALHRGYLPDHESFDSYRYIQTGHKSPMVAWRIRFDLDTEKHLGIQTTRRNTLLKEFCSHYFKQEPKDIPKGPKFS